MADNCRRERESVRLFNILDAVGASTEIIQRTREAHILQEIGLTYTAPFQDSGYVFGSCSEGTGLPGSDMDIVSCNEAWPVVNHVDEGPEFGECLLALSDYTKPGYVQLQTVLNRIPQTMSHRRLGPFLEEADKHGRICITHVSFLGIHPGFQTRSGPSDVYSIPCDSGEQDTVLAFRSRQITRRKNTLSTNQIRGDWPSTEQFDKMKTQGCLYVGVGHPRSSNKHLEWRISFSLQERELMFSLNPTQIKCYILLKMIKKDIIHPKIEKSITSYHCKTCLFYTIQKAGNRFWIPENLLQAVRLCLQQILTWIEDGHCPNFFVPDENMFDKVANVSLCKVADILKEELSTGIDFIHKLQTNDVGKLWESASNSSLAEVRLEHETMINLNLLSMHLFRIYFLRRPLLEKIFSPKGTPHTHLSALKTELANLQLKRSNVDHTNEEFHKALDPVIPHIRLQMAIFTSCIMSSENDTSHFGDLKTQYKHHLEKGQRCDLISAKLVDATHSFKCGKFQNCEDILQDCTSCVKAFVISVCRCYRHKIIQSEEFVRKVLTCHMHVDEIREKCTTGCLLFLPAVADMVPLALQYEMYRSMYTTRTLTIEETRYWFDWMLVDSQVYLHYLQYLLYSKHNNRVSKKEAMTNLARLLHVDPNLGHRETGLNLLGWMFLQENMLNQALFAFWSSWRLRPHLNAAKWHLALVFYKYTTLMRSNVKK